MAAYLKKALGEEGYAVTVCNDGDEGFDLARRGSFDVLVLDVMLPGRSGLDIVAEIKKAKSVPVLLVSAKSATNDRVDGLDGGADDYLPKPFAIEEFKARVRALMRRNTNQPATSLSCADLHVDLLARKVTRAGKEVNLTAREFALLEYLLRNQGRVMARTSIAEHVWGYSFDWESNILEVFINQLRNKVDRDYKVKLLHTVRGVGYKLNSNA